MMSSFQLMLIQHRRMVLDGWCRRVPPMLARDFSRSCLLMTKAQVTAHTPGVSLTGCPDELLRLHSLHLVRHHAPCSSVAWVSLSFALPLLLTTVRGFPASSCQAPESTAELPCSAPRSGSSWSALPAHRCPVPGALCALEAVALGHLS